MPKSQVLDSHVADLIAAGADDHYINPAWSYTFSLGDFVGDKGRGLQVVEG